MFIKGQPDSLKMKEIILQNNRSHAVDKAELNELIIKAREVYLNNFDNKTWFERSVFINWTCAIADCKYCFLSTKPKYNSLKGTTAIRSVESILAEILISTALGWKIGYITGGLRVESADYLIELLDKISLIAGEKVMMNFGPYSRQLVEKFSPHVSGMGSAVESFDENLHNFICPSKPLKSLLDFLSYLQEFNKNKLITIILGMGEKIKDVDLVIENIRKFEIEKIQLCFLKPQKNTIFSEVPSPDPNYMAYWISRIRIACPAVVIKVALVRSRINDVSLYLQAGANCFSRFMVFSDFGTSYAEQLEEGCRKASRKLVGEFYKLPDIDVGGLVDKLPFNDELKKKILPKAKQYYNKLKK